MLTCSQIIEIVSTQTGITPEQIKSSSRKANIVQARHISMVLSRWHTKDNLLNISLSHGRVNHATVLHACENIYFDIRTNPQFRNLFESCENLVKNA